LHLHHNKELFFLYFVLVTPLEQNIVAPSPPALHFALENNCGMGANAPHELGGWLIYQQQY
jgi:hypothetical protein